MSGRPCRTTSGARRRREPIRRWHCLVLLLPGRLMRRSAMSSPRGYRSPPYRSHGTRTNPRSGLRVVHQMQITIIHSPKPGLGLLEYDLIILAGLHWKPDLAQLGTALYLLGYPCHCRPIFPWSSGTKTQTILTRKTRQLASMRMGHLSRVVLGSLPIILSNWSIIGVNGRLVSRWRLNRGAVGERTFTLG